MYIATYRDYIDGVCVKLIVIACKGFTRKTSLYINIYIIRIRERHKQTQAHATAASHAHCAWAMWAR